MAWDTDSHGLSPDAASFMLLWAAVKEFKLSFKYKGLLYNQIMATEARKLKS